MDTINRLITWGKSHILILILLLATTLRLFNLASNPPGLNWDEVSMGYSAYSLLETGKDEWGVSWPLLFRSYGEWKSPVYIYLLIPFIKVFGLNAWAVRLPAAIAGILAVYLTYLIGKKLYSENVGLWAALLLSVSQWHLMLSRPGFEAGVALTLVLAGIYLFLKEKPIFATLPLGIAIHTYHSAKLVVPIIIVYLAISNFKKIGFKKLAISALILGIFALPIATDLLTGRSQKRFAQVGITTDAELVERFFKYRGTFPLGDLAGKLVFNKYTFILSKGFSNWTSYLSPHFLLGSESIRAQHSIPFRGVLYFTEFALIIFGLTLLFKKYSGVARYLPLLMIAIGFVPPALTKDIYHVLRSILTLPWWQLLAAIGIVELQNNKKFHKLFTFTLLLLTCEILILLFQYFAWYPKAFAKDWQYGYKQAVEYIETSDKPYKEIFFTKTYGEPQIFVAFYSKLDPKIYQEASKSWLEYESLGLPWLDQLKTYKLGNYTFGDIRYMGGSRGGDTLYVGKADDFWADTHVLQKIDFADHNNAFTITDGQ
jgi:4-amino-4-deoxy-L-arabinose transferase-like glycosyltransferase